MLIGIDWSIYSHLGRLSLGAVQRERFAGAASGSRLACRTSCFNSLLKVLNESPSRRGT